eukprot:TRINITY_DN841_c0_g1_i1.p1 TRINITY_DN841_c0_g1~~TRINITY_DN841_c0_g1_i1.p1  ORF type:complete len:269 (+),score=64.31 TRINITY_DN841_c0_g1_i1:316-1122(+)
MALQTGLKQYEELKAALGAQNVNIEQCGQLLTKLKITLAELSAFFPDPARANSTTRTKELLLARETLELACIFATRSQDMELFQRSVAQLKTFYQDVGRLGQPLPESERQNLILGLNLLSLLSQNRIAEFHTELETIPIERHDNLYIKHPILLEQHLMEGNYTKVWAARHETPDASYSFFMGPLMKTIREEAADCAEHAYKSLSANAALSMLHCENADELSAFAQTRGWTIDNGIVNFHTDEKADREIPTKKVIEDTLHYARELERIV